MKLLLSFVLLAMLLAGCGDPVREEGDGLLDMYNENTNGSSLDPNEVPYSTGPTEIPSDLVPHE